MQRGSNGIPEGWLGLSVEGGEGRKLGSIRKQGNKAEGRGLSAFPLPPASLPTLAFAKWGGSTLDSPLPGDSDEAKSQALWLLGGTGMQVGENTPVEHTGREGHQGGGG